MMLYALNRVARILDVNISISCRYPLSELYVERTINSIGSFALFVTCLDVLSPGCSHAI